MKTKKCSKCKRELPITEFVKDNKNRDKLFCWCKKCQRNLSHIYYQNNIIRLKNYYKEYYQQNQKNIEKQQIQYRRIRINQDINYKILKNLRKRLYSVLKNTSKSAKTLDLLGCSVEFLKQYLQSKFQPGMSWDNYGKWHIDHIIPCVSFDLSKSEEQHKCFNYNNLQPLWAKDNIKKSIYLNSC